METLPEFTRNLAYSRSQRMQAPPAAVQNINNGYFITASYGLFYHLQNSTMIRQTYGLLVLVYQFDATPHMVIASAITLSNDILCSILSHLLSSYYTNLSLFTKLEPHLATVVQSFHHAWSYGSPHTFIIPDQALVLA